jgi:hypothetical protein
MFRVAAAIGLLAGGLSVAAPVPKALKKTESLDGRWVTTERMVGRTDMTNTPWGWEIEGEKLTTFDVANGNLTPSGTTGITLFAPDPKKPNELDFLHVSGTSKYLWRGLMTWDGGGFVICFGDEGKERPTEVKNSPAVYSYYRFKRVSEK